MLQVANKSQSKLCDVWWNRNFGWIFCPISFFFAITVLYHLQKKIGLSYSLLCWNMPLCFVNTGLKIVTDMVSVVTKFSSPWWLIIRVYLPKMTNFFRGWQRITFIFCVPVRPSNPIAFKFEVLKKSPETWRLGPQTIRFPMWFPKYVSNENNNNDRLFVSEYSLPH